jgi:type I restriction enzyme M protein
MKTYDVLTIYLTKDRIVINNMRKDIQAKLKGMPDLLSIGQVAEIFNIHPDTLRNWEKDGNLVPMRSGKRGDRKYRPQDIQAIVDKMGSKLTLPQLEQFLWKSADILRGKIDSSDYKKYIFGLLFFKRISDVWDEEYARVIAEYNDESIARADYNHRFQVPKECRWSVVEEQAENIGKKLNEVFEKLANANSPKLDKIFDDLDFANKDRFPNETLQRLVNHFSQYNFGDTYISSDILGDAYEYLIKQFAADAGKKGGEFYTPREVERLIIQILKPHKKDHIYDPTVGSGGFLLEAFHYLKEKENESVARTLYLYGQEINLSTFAIAKINMFLHGLDSADIQRGDTLANPHFLNPNGTLQTFDICVANPPYSIKDWESEVFRSNKHGRIDGYEMPPEKNADYAFLLHIIKSMNSNGRAGIVVPHGVLFRTGVEARIREKILKNDLIEAVITLPPKLFYGTGIPAAVLILNRNKHPNKKGKVMIINGEKDYFEGKNQNSLRKQDIDKITKAYDVWSEIDKYARVVDLEEITANKFSLNVRQYVDNSEAEEQVDVQGVLAKLESLEKEQNALEKKISQLISPLFRKPTKKGDLKKVIAGNKKYEIPKHWDICKIADTSTLKGRIGWQGLTTKEYLDSGEYYLVTGTDFKDGRIAWETCHFVEKERYDQDSNIQIKEKDILVTKDGTIGKVAFVDVLPEKKATLNSGIFVLRPIDGAYLPEYMFWLLQSAYFKSFINDIKAGSTISHLYQRDFNEFKFICPPLDEQKKIVEVLSWVDKKYANNKKVTAHLEMLRNGLSSDLLSGRLRTL